MNSPNQHLKKASHSVYDLRYQLVWTTKYRKPIFIENTALKIREIIRQVCLELNIEILSGSVKKDCVKIIISAPPTICLSQLIGKIKEKSANLMFKENEALRNIYPNGHLWSRGYFVSTNIYSIKKENLKFIEIQENEE